VVIFADIGSSNMKTVADKHIDMLFIITSTDDELFSGSNINNLK